MLKLETKADLEALHIGNIRESISLEYKASLAIDKADDNKKIEISVLPARLYARGPQQGFYLDGFASGESWSERSPVAEILSAYGTGRSSTRALVIFGSPIGQRNNSRKNL